LQACAHISEDATQNPSHAKKTTRTDLMDNFTVNIMSLFAIIEFYYLIHTFLDLKQLFLIFPLNFSNGVFIITLVDIGRAKSEKIISMKPSYKFDQYMALL
jgi:hypothetical protein